jgi:putative hemolysin
MIAGVMRLGDLPVGAVMTPRHGTMINLSEPDEAIRFAFRTTHSRLPVFDGEETLGIIQSKDMLDAYLAGEAPTSAS